MNLLQKYIAGDLSENEVDLVSKELVVAQLDREIRKDWENKLKENHGTERDIKKVKFLFNSKKAILLSLIAALIYYLFSISGISNKSSNLLVELVNEEISNLNIMSDQSVIRKGENSINAIRQNASIAYIEKDYDASIKYLTIIESKEELNASDCFYLATSYLLNFPSSPKKTISFLTKARVLNKSVFLEEIDWIISLAYIKDNQFENAKLELSKIVSRNKYKADSAKKLLDKLNVIE